MTDEAGLRRLALDVLGPLGDALAREALEHGALVVEPAEVSWEGTAGHVRGVRATLRLEAGLCARVLASPATVDALVAAVAIAVASPGRALADLSFSPGDVPRRERTPYR